MAGTTNWTVGFKKATTWGTAVALGAGNKIKIESETMSDGIPEVIRDDNVGDRLSGGTYQGNKVIEGNIVLAPRFEGFERLIAQLQGADTFSEPQVGIVGQHLMDFQASNTGIFGTLAMDKGIGTLGAQTQEYESIKVVSVELNYKNGKLMATVGLIANHLERTAPVNGNAQFVALTLPAAGLIVLFNQLTVRAKAVTGAEGNLSGTDDLKVSDARITINRNIKGDVVAGSNGEIDEPETDGLPVASVTLTFPNYTAAVDALVKPAQTLQANRRPTLYKMELFSIGPTIAGSSPAVSHEMRWLFPALTIGKAPTNAGNPGAKVPVEVTFHVVTPEAGALPNGADWTWVVADGAPFRLKMVNGETVSALA